MLENAQAKDVSKVLTETLANRSASDGGFKIAVHPDHSAVILSGTTEEIREALEVVAKLDSRPGR